MATSPRRPHLGKLLQTGEYADLTLVCGDQEFRAHKAVVCAQSAVLAAAIKEPFEASKSGRITVNEFDTAQITGMMEFLYIGDYSSPSCDKNDRTDAKNAGSLASGAENAVGDHSTPEETLLQHVRMNAVADFYDIPGLADLSCRKVKEAIAETKNGALVLDAAKEMLETTRDLALHELLADAAADQVREYLETDLLMDLIGSFGVQLLKKLVKEQDDRMAALVATLDHEQRCRETAETRASRILANIESCMDTLMEHNECRSQSCRGDFDCYFEKRGNPSEPSFMLRCSLCRCKH
ncbi:hypothetical protein NLG97_g7171 [Lecanicillium saksenae]|uniref:Uncharacterized protein n=1 Tax=Lecanicillium saksenae TaxID=468837 RepID=A0ACC1QN41_9HYPO|nr:hypothetical protein NLG97_g7171 [Lecanicillium saksenae]